MDYKFLTYEKIDGQGFLSGICENPEAGAVVTFFGTIRNNSMGKKVSYLIYESYEALADKTIKDIIEKTSRQWSLLEINVIHRLGRHEIGDIAIAIAVRSKHRDESYKASRFIIDEIKHNVPIWKKEHFEDGTCEWGRCCRD